MREIICKAKRKDNGEWIEGYYCYDTNDKPCIQALVTHEFKEYDPKTLCWLTHMKDINGDEIWENDIIECLSNNFVLQVVWSDECQQFLFEILEGGYDFMIGKAYELSAVARDKKIKIVGNIFDEEE